MLSQDLPQIYTIPAFASQSLLYCIHALRHCGAPHIPPIVQAPLSSPGESRCSLHDVVSLCLWSEERPDFVSKTPLSGFAPLSRRNRGACGSPPACHICSYSSLPPSLRGCRLPLLLLSLLLLQPLSGNLSFLPVFPFELNLLLSRWVLCRKRRSNMSMSCSLERASRPLHC